MVVCWRRSEESAEVLLLHRSGSDGGVDWEWTPPSGARYPGETVTDCARRELAEETGLDLTPEPVALYRNWALFAVEVPPGLVPKLDIEHDRFEWVDPEEAAQRCRPAEASEAVGLAVSRINDASL
jgi:8-oxo-dGTP pyrophosphatase MutT (NUDIX family)